jgi:putative adhesin/cell wall-active antibiotic response 4TMS protein YvqF
VSNGGQTRGSIFSGVLLILLGVLFLFARWNPDLHIWHVFWHYWPVLIILWGVAKLVDHLGAHQDGRARPPMVTGSEVALMLLVVLLLAGMGLYSRIRERNPDLDINLNMFHEQASQNVDVPVKTIPAHSHVTLATDHGNITCHAGEGNDLRVSANETASEANESAAQERLKNVNVVIEQGPDGYTVHPVNQSGGRGNVNVDLDVTVPKSASITANTDHGNVSVSGVAGKITVTATHGDVEVHDAGSDVSVDMTKGDARISAVGGNVRISGRGNEVEASDVAGDATIEGEFFGPVHVRNVTKTTHYASQKADLTLVHMTGRLELDSGQIEVSDVAGFAKLNTKNKDLDVENVVGRLEVTDVHGDIKVGYAQPPREEISITNESGGVDLTLPAKSNFQISASSHGGEVQSDFEGSTDSEGDNPRYNAKIGTGVPKIQITTTYGTIYVRKSS